MRKEWKEIAVCLAIIAVSALIYWDSLKLPPGNYDPLGGGTMPRIICATMIILSLVALGQIMVPLLAGTAVSTPARKSDYQKRPGMALVIFGLTVIYALSIQLRLPFTISTVLFLLLSTMVLARFRLKFLPGAVAISLGVGLSLNYLFTAIFKVDLP